MQHLKKKTDNLNPLNTISILYFLQTRLLTEQFSRTSTIHPGVFRGRALSFEELSADSCPAEI